MSLIFKSFTSAVLTEDLKLLSVHLQTRLPADGGSGADPLELEAALQQLQVTHTEPTFQRFHSPPESFTFGSQMVDPVSRSYLWVTLLRGDQLLT